MLRENTVFAHKIVDFYAEKGVECSVVDEHLSLLITLYSDGREHEFRYGKRAFAELNHSRKFYRTLEREFSRLRTAPAPAGRR